MNASIRLQSQQAMRNGERNPVSLPKRDIDIIFISLSPLELPVKNLMNDSAVQSASDTPTLGDSRFPQNPPAAGRLSQLQSERPNGEGERHESDLFDASWRALARHRPPDNSMPPLRLVEFSVTLPDAKLVQLAAEFTDWDEAPLHMVRFDGGIWSTTVPLPAGIYSFRFLVDGEWYDDPRAIRRDSYSLLTSTAFVKVK